VELPASADPLPGGFDETEVTIDLRQSSLDAGGKGRSFAPPYPLDLRATLAPLRRGGGDPTHQVDADGTIWRTSPTPEGPATLRLRREASGTVRAHVWGPGTRWMLDAVPRLLGADDDWSGFTPHHECVADSWRRNPGLRLTRTGLILEQLAPAILEQKVTGVEAWRSWRELVRRFGTVAPGPAPAGMRVAPYADQWRTIPVWEWHKAGVDGARQRAIRAAALVADRLEQAASMTPEDAQRRLQAVPGIGPWTAAEVVQRALGAPDAVSVGDYHLPTVVGWALVGRGLDEGGMLTALGPYKPHRQRAIRLVEAAGVRPPRHGPRMSARDYRAF
jgi:3-methyladenine DNA glycosylase/8-oxoguanine DNA glycosylase